MGTVVTLHMMQKRLWIEVKNEIKRVGWIEKDNALYKRAMSYTYFYGSTMQGITVD
jgi:hypothetical protein